MAMIHKEKGFALLIAVIFMSVMLSFGLMLGSLGYKQSILASTSVDSQYAFYAADAALECALRYDQVASSILAFPASDPPAVPRIQCSGAEALNDLTYTNKSFSAAKWTVRNRLSLNNADGDPAYCADITVEKYATAPDPTPNKNFTTYIFSQGYSVPCSVLPTITSSKVRVASRGIQAHY